MYRDIAVLERLQEEIKKGKSNFEALVKEEALLLDIAKWWYLIRLGELGGYKISLFSFVCSQVFPIAELALKIPELRRRPTSTYESLREGARCQKFSSY